MESDFALIIIHKLLFMLQVIPQQVSLVRIDCSEYPTDQINLYEAQFNLGELILKSCSSKVIESYQTFEEFVIFLNKVCELSVTSQVSYVSQGKQLNLIDQLCFTLHEEILNGYLQPLLLKK